MRCRWFRLQGSYTVEAALIVPLVLGVLFVLMYTLFCLRDRAVLCGSLQERILAAQSQEKIYLADDEWTQSLQGRMWVLEIVESNVTTSGWSLSGEIAAKSSLETPFLQFFSKRESFFSMHIKRTKRLPAEMVWIRSLERGGKNGGLSN